MTLRRLILEFGRDGIQVRALYRSEAKDGPGTKARKREVQGLTIEGLTSALRALEGSARVDVVGTSGFTTREDTILCTGRGFAPSGLHKKPTKGAA